MTKADDPVAELKATAKRDERHYTDRQLADLLSANRGPQRNTIERLIWNVRNARQVARDRQRQLEARQDTAELLDKKLPSDRYAEATVLGTLMTHPDLIDQHGLTPAHFLTDDHELIFQAMLRIRERGEPVDARHVAEELKRDERWLLAEHVQQLHDLIDSSCVPSRFQEYVKRVDELYERREMFFAAVEVIKQVHTDKRTEDIQRWARREFC